MLEWWESYPKWKHKRLQYLLILTRFQCTKLIFFLTQLPAASSSSSSFFAIFFVFASLFCVFEIIHSLFTQFQSPESTNDRLFVLFFFFPTLGNVLQSCHALTIGDSANLYFTGSWNLISEQCSCGTGRTSVTELPNGCPWFLFISFHFCSVR